MKALAQMYRERALAEVAEYIAKASATDLDIAKAHYRDMAEFHKAAALKWELLSQ